MRNYTQIKNVSLECKPGQKREREWWLNSSGDKALLKHELDSNHGWKSPAMKMSLSSCDGLNTEHGDENLDASLIEDSALAVDPSFDSVARLVVSSDVTVFNDVTTFSSVVRVPEATRLTISAPSGSEMWPKSKTPI